MRDAATVLLVRDEPQPHGGTALEVFMVRRHAHSGFVGGHHVFPGGVVDEADHDPAWVERCRGEADPFAIAATRELLEEAGILLAVHRGTRSGEPIERDRISAMARSVHAGSSRFIDACRESDLALRTDDLLLWSHWITPEGEPRRYDTRFFVAGAPRDQEAIHDELELTAGSWGTPSSFLEQHGVGEIQMILPTVATLHSIDGFSTTDELLAAAAARGPVAPTTPELRRSDNGTVMIYIDGLLVWTQPPPVG